MNIDSFVRSISKKLEPYQSDAHIIIAGIADDLTPYIMIDTDMIITATREPCPPIVLLADDPLPQFAADNANLVKGLRTALYKLAPRADPLTCPVDFRPLAEVEA